MPMMPNSTRPLRLAFILFLALFGVICMTSPEEGRLLDSVDLAIHETGHLVFAPFGEFMGLLGGTLFQLLMPGAFVAYFLRRGDGYAAGVVLWWVAQNFWNISVYAADARSRVLPLVGGGEHDWHHILLRLGLLQQDWLVAKVIHFTGILVFGVALYISVRHAAAPSDPTGRS
ncbi:MAG TPA: hypothetical protein VF188_16825 [Longimicrobiales bacterium]